MRTEENKRPNHLGFLTTLGDPNRGIIGGFLILNGVGRPTEFHCTAPVRPNRAQEILYGATLEGFVCGEQIAQALINRTKTDLAVILTNNPNVLTARNTLKAPLGMVFQHSKETLKKEDKEKYAVWENSPKNGKAENNENDGVPPWIEEEERGETVETNAETTPRMAENVNDEGVNLTVRPYFYRSFADIPFVPGLDLSEWRETTKGKNRLALPISFAQEGATAVPFDEVSARLDVFFKSIDSVEPFERIRLAVEEAQKSC